MNLGARASFNRIEDLKDHFKGVDFPIEFALPYRVGDFLSIVDRLDEIRDFVLVLQLKALSVHAPQGNLIAEASIICPSTDSAWRWSPSSMRSAGMAA